MNAKLVAEHVGKTFRQRHRWVTAIADLNLYVVENEFVSLLGPSGCGKSTFLMMAAGLDFPTSGRLLFNGSEITGPSIERGMVFQSYTLFPWLTVAENIRFALQKRSLPRSRQDELVAESVRRVGLEGFEQAYPAQLSGGMRQRVAIARALVYRPQMLLMDEPFGALDAQTRLLMQELLLRVWESARTTVLFVTHDVDEAILLSDRVYVMTARPGTIKAEVTIDLPRPRTAATESTPRYVELRRLILEQIHIEAQRAFTSMAS